MSVPDYISKVAIIGASGHVGQHFTTELLKTGKHTVTVLTRPTSTATFPQGTQVVRVDYSDHSALVSALRGQHFLIITLAARGPAPELHTNIVKAAIEAGVPFIMPNNYGANIRNKKVLEIEPIVAANAQKAQEIQDLGGAYIVMACGLWYEWSLAAGEEWFGFDIKNRKVTFTDDGLTKIWTSTWEQCGRGLAALLSLPVHKDKAGSNGLALEQFKNDQIILESFRVNQRDMLDSLHRVLGTTDADWDIRSEPRQKRLEDGQRDMMNGDVAAFAKQLYAKLMRPEAQELEVEGIEKKLGLPKESLDEATKRAVDMAEGDWTPFG